MENLHIGICHTKIQCTAQVVYKAWESGLSRHGDRFTHIFSQSDLLKHNFDALLCISYPQFDNINEILIREHPYLENRPPNFPSPISEFRKQIINFANEKKIRLIFIDTGVIGCSRARDGNLLDYYQVGFDCIKGLGCYYNNNMPSDRFDQLNVELKDWRAPNNHVLMFGQVRFGIGSQNIDIWAWYRYCLRYMRDNNFRTYYLEHPNVGEPFRHEKFKIVTIQKRACKYDNDIGTTLAFSTNASIDAIINGIPSICMSKLSPAYNVCSNNLEDLKNPKIFDRKQFLYNLAYTQFQIREMENGDCWSFIRNNVKKEPSTIYPIKINNREQEYE